MPIILGSLLVLFMLALIAGYVGYQEPANMPFIVLFTGALIVASILAAVHELKARP